MKKAGFFQQLRIIRLLGIVLVLGVGCQSQLIDDASITAAVKSKLMSDSAPNLTRIEVATNNGIVFLTGSVDTADQKMKAEQLAKQVGGVKNVVNNLDIRPS